MDEKSVTADVAKGFHDGAYRRGFVHGLNEAIEAIDSGATRQEIARYLDHLNSRWRYNKSRCIVPPPTFGVWQGENPREENRVILPHNLTEESPHPRKT